jgi:SOS-response transcriptional repressor LexA
MKDLNAIVAENLKKLRAEKGYRVTDVANIIGVSQPSVSAWENGKKLPRASTLQKLAKLYEVSSEEIVNDEATIDERTNKISDDAIVDFENLLTSKTRLVYLGKTLSQKEKAITNNLVKAVVMEDIYDVDNEPKEVSKPVIEDNPPYISKKIMLKLTENVFTFEKTTKLTPIPILGSIAAGIPIDSVENFDGYRDVADDFLIQGFDYFWVLVTGDSMQPAIPKYSYVLLQCVPDVNDGEIGAVLFEDDTKTTLKKIYHEHRKLKLVSTNKEYEPMYVTEDNPAIIIGKAVKVEMDLN